MENFKNYIIDKSLLPSFANYVLGREGNLVPSIDVSGLVINDDYSVSLHPILKDKHKNFNGVQLNENIHIQDKNKIPKVTLSAIQPFSFTRDHSAHVCFAEKGNLLLLLRYVKPGRVFRNGNIKDIVKLFNRDDDRHKLRKILENQIPKVVSYSFIDDGENNHQDIVAIHLETPYQNILHVTDYKSSYDNATKALMKVIFTCTQQNVDVDFENIHLEELFINWGNVESNLIFLRAMDIFRIRATEDDGKHAVNLWTKLINSDVFEQLVDEKKQPVLYTSNCNEVVVKALNMKLNLPSSSDSSDSAETNKQISLYIYSQMLRL